VNAISTYSILLDFAKEKEKTGLFENTTWIPCSYCVSAFQAQLENIVFITIVPTQHKDIV